MAIRVFLDANDLFTVADNHVSVTGAAGGNETVLLQSSVRGLNLDANIERLNFSGKRADYIFSLLNHIQN